MFKGDVIPGIITTVFGAFVVIYTLVEDTMKVNSQASDGVPGAGFFPVILGALLILMGVILTIKSLLKKDRKPYFKLTEEQKYNVKKLLLVVVSIIVFFILWRTTRLFIACAALLSFILNIIFKRSLKFNIIYTVVFTAFLYLVFVTGFSVQFNR